MDDKFYGHIYANMGAAYGKLFLYQESARMYDRAFLICGDVSMLEPYLYASYRYMSMEEYHILLTKNETYMEVNEKMRQRCDEIRKETEKPYTFQDLEDWKYQYRRSHV